MRVIDLSHAINADTPVYPGTAPVLLEPLNTLARNGFVERLVTMASHTGTHMDAPAHLFFGGITLDAMPAERFVSRACVLDIDGAGPLVARAVLEAQADRLAGNSVALLRTGWSRHWGERAYFAGFPVLAQEAARWLVAQGVTAVGVDAISVDPVESRELPIHRVLLGAGVLVIENLAHLELLPPCGFTLVCLPLPLAQADGAPCRAVALVDGR